MEELDLLKFSWIDMDKFEMKLIEFQSSSIWKQKFIDLRVDNIEKRTIADLKCHSCKIFRA